MEPNIASTVNTTETPKKPLFRETVILAGVLGLFFGGFGVHNFMIHRTKRGIIQAVITVSLFGLAMTLFVIMFFDSFKCGTGSIGSCEKLNLPFDALLAICSYAVGGMFGWGAIESLIILIKANQYPLKTTPNPGQESSKPLPQ